MEKYRIVQDGNGFYKVQSKKDMWGAKWEDISLSFDKYSDAKYIFNTYKLTVLDKI